MKGGIEISESYKGVYMSLTVGALSYFQLSLGNLTYWENRCSLGLQYVFMV